MRRSFLLLTVLLCCGIPSMAQVIPFDTIRWSFLTAKPAVFQGRECIMGKAVLKGMNIKNGVIETDMAVTGERSYPGILFRVSTEADYERVYLRPHLPDVFQNVVQYVSTFNGIDSWQLYSGPGYTAAAQIPRDRWFHLKIVFSGDQAAVYLDNNEEPVLRIPHLGHGTGEGAVGVDGPADGSAYFSNFSCREEEALKFPPSPAQETPYGILPNWQLSQVFKMAAVDYERMPDSQGLAPLRWTDAHCRPDGIVDVSRYFRRQGNSPDLIFARTFIDSEKEGTKQFAFGYSDLISVFINGDLVFCGNSSYTSRDPNFQGIVGLNDYLSLPLKKGRNELTIALAEGFGGWGFIFRDAKAVYQDPLLRKKWEIGNTFRVPESVQYDRKRNVLYVSNFYNDGKEFISKVRPDGEILSLEWAGGIVQPTGMTMTGDRLYVVGRFALAEIDPESGTVLKRYRFPDPGMPNDVTADSAGTLYVTDSQKGCIYRLSEGKMTEWLVSPELMRANGLISDQGKLIVGTSADGCIKTIDPATKSVTTMLCLGAGTVMDGIASLGNGSYLISDYSGKIYKVNPGGEKRLLLDATAPGMFCAAFEYITELHFLVIPTYSDNRVVAYELKE